MKLFKKILLAIGVILLLAQIPGIFHRIRLGSISGEIQRLDQSRKVTVPDGYSSYKGILHLHSKIGGHSSGTIEQIADAAGKTGVDFVVMTEHLSKNSDTSKDSFSGVINKTLVIGGHEMESSDGNRYLVIDSFPGVVNLTELPAAEFVRSANKQGSLAFVTHPERNKNLGVSSDGFEVFSLHTSIKKVNPVSFLMDALWSYSKYPELTVLSHFERPEENLRQYDKLAAKRPLSLFASTDAHSNIGLKLGGNDANPWIDIKLDPYEEVFRIVCVHIFVKKENRLDRDSVIEALGHGQFYVGLDALGNSDGFVFEADDGNSKVLMGGEINLSNDLKINAVSPLPARFVVYRDGKKFSESGITSEISIKISDRGVYRVEVYQDGLGAPFDKLPWIMSNPIYIR